MTIRTKKTDVPSEFPPAQLYLDDIEEIVRILRELVESRKFSEHSTVEDLKFTVTLSIGTKECEDVLDLPKIAGGRTRTSDLEIAVSRGGWVDTSLRFRRFGSLWRSSGLTKEDTWKAFHKLQPLFKERNAGWRTLLRSAPWWLAALSGYFVLTLFAVLRFLLKQLMPPILASTISTILVGTLVIAIAVGLFAHTTVILRHSSEPSALRQDLLQKAPLAASRYSASTSNTNTGRSQAHALTSAAYSRKPPGGPSSRRVPQVALFYLDGAEGQTGSFSTLRVSSH